MYGLQKEFGLFLASFVTQCSTLQEKEERRPCKDSTGARGCRARFFTLLGKHAPAFLGNNALHLQSNDLPWCSERAVYRNYPLSTAVVLGKVPSVKYGPQILGRKQGMLLISMDMLSRTPVSPAYCLW